MNVAIPCNRYVSTVEKRGKKIIPKKKKSNVKLGRGKWRNDLEDRKKKIILYTLLEKKKNNAPCCCGPPCGNGAAAYRRVGVTG